MYQRGLRRSAVCVNSRLERRDESLKIKIYPAKQKPIGRRVPQKINPGPAVLAATFVCVYRPSGAQPPRRSVSSFCFHVFLIYSAAYINLTTPRIGVNQSI